MLADHPIHAVLGTRDLARSTAWYAEKLGWSPNFDEPGIVGYTIDGSDLTIYETPNGGTAKNTVANWNVADLDATMARLRANGVMFEDYDFGEFKTVDGVLGDPTQGFFNAWFKDPDGNTWGVLQFAGSPEATRISPMIAASDLDRAKAWYAEKLGLEAHGSMPEQVLNFTSGGQEFSV